MDQGQACLDVRGLTVERGHRNLIDGLSFTASSAALVHIKGPNGSGKTTAIRAMAGLVSPLSGQVLWDGRPIAANAGFIAALNYVGHLPGLSAELSGRENLEFIADVSAKRCSLSIDRALAELHASQFADEPIRRLSAGQRQRIALARLVLFDCPLWLLDEPFTALDGHARKLLEGLIDGHLDAGGIVVIATHQSFDSQRRPHEIALGQGAG